MNADTDIHPEKKIYFKKIIQSIFNEFGAVLAFVTIYAALIISFKYYNHLNSGWPVILGLIVGFILLVVLLFGPDPNWSQLGWSMYWICPLLPFVILNISIGSFSINNPWLTRKPKYELILNGVPITDNKTRWLIPSRHDIQKVPLNQSVDADITATTKDGLTLKAKVKVDLRRADDPYLWKDPTRYETSLQKIIEGRFKEICLKMDSKSISTESLQMAFQLLDTGDNSLRDILPPNVQLNGAVKIAEITAFQKE